MRQAIGQQRYVPPSRRGQAVSDSAELRELEGAAPARVSQVRS